MPNRLIKNLEGTAQLRGKTILIVGATGFIGSEIGLCLARYGCIIRGIDNSTPQGEPNVPYPCSYTYWQYSSPIPAAVVRGVDAIINVAGAKLLGDKWTPERRQEILDTKVFITRRCVEAANLHEVPIMLQMSWSGIYGTTHTSWANEWFPNGKEIAAQWATQWEQATSSLRRAKTRLVIMRSSSVLSHTGGPLLTFIQKYMYGLGASLRQDYLYFSWIHIEDFLAFVTQAIIDPSIEGPYNVCTDQPCTYLQAHVLLKGYYPNQLVMSASSGTIKMTTGDKAPLYLQSARVYPKRLKDRGFKFKFSSVEDTLADLLDYKVDSIIHYRYRFYIPASRREVYRYISDITNWPKFYPPNVKLGLADYTSNPIKEGTEIGYRIKYLGVNFGWREKVLNCDPGYTFQVMQLYGPLNFYEVTRNLEEVGDGTVYDIWHRCRITYGPVFNQIAYRNIQSTHAKVRQHQGLLLSECFPKQNLQRAG